jgi:hypothetical protein
MHTTMNVAKSGPGVMVYIGGKLVEDSFGPGSSS